MRFVQSLSKVVVFIIILAIWIETVDYEYTFEVPVMGGALGAWLACELILTVKNESNE